MWNHRIVYLMLVSSCFIACCWGHSDLLETVASTIGILGIFEDPLSIYKKSSEEAYEDPHSFYKKPSEEESENPHLLYRKPSEQNYEDPHSVQVKPSVDIYEDPHSFSKKPSQEKYEDPRSFSRTPAEDEESPSLVQKIGNYLGCDEICKSHCSPCEDELRLCNVHIRNKPGNSDVSDVLLSRRLVNTLLSRSNLIEDGEMFSSHLKLELTREELELLREFGRGMLTLRQIDPILNNVIKAPTEDPVLKAFEFLSDSASLIYSTSIWLSLILIEYMEVAIAIPITLYLMFILNGRKYNLWMFLTVGTVSILIVSFIITWRKLIQEAEIKHSTLQMQYMKLPEHCRPDATFWTSVWTIFRSADECTNYHAARMKTPFLEVTPAQALSHMLSHIVLEPIAILGKAIAAFLQNVTTDMSPLLSGIVQIAICVSCLPILVVTVILLAGGTLKLGGFGPLSFLSLTGAKKKNTDETRAVDSKNERQAVEIVLKLEANDRLAGNVSLGDPNTSKALPVTNEAKKTKSKCEAIASTSKPIANETLDDHVSSADSSDSEDRFVDSETSERGGSDVKESPEIGSGDHA